MDLNTDILVNSVRKLYSSLLFVLPNINNQQVTVIPVQQMSYRDSKIHCHYAECGNYYINRPETKSRIPNKVWCVSAWIIPVAIDSTVFVIKPTAVILDFTICKRFLREMFL